MFGSSWNSWPTPWPQKSRTTRAALGLGVSSGWRGRCRRWWRRASPRRCRASCLIGDLDQPLGLARRSSPTAYIAAGIAVPAVDDDGDVDVDDVAVAQRLVARDAVADDVVDRGADRLAIAAIASAVAGMAPWLEGELADELGRSRRSARPARRCRSSSSRHFADQRAGLAHAGKRARVHAA